MYRFSKQIQSQKIADGAKKSLMEPKIADGAKIPKENPKTPYRDFSIYFEKIYFENQSKIPINLRTHIINSHINI